MPRQHLPQSHGAVYFCPAGGGAGDRLRDGFRRTSREEIGNPIYPPAKRKLKEMGVPFGDHRAVQMTRADYDRYDLLLAADSANVRNMTRIAGGDPEHKIRRLLDDCPRPRDIADPWYTGNFDVTYDDIVEGCEALLDRLEREGKT